MDSKEVNFAPRPFESEDWYREGIKAAQEKIIIKKYLKNKIADPE